MRARLSGARLGYLSTAAAEVLRVLPISGFGHAEICGICAWEKRNGAISHGTTPPSMAALRRIVIVLTMALSWF